MAVGGIEEQLGAIGVQQPLHASLAGCDELRDPRIAQVGGLARHGRHHLVGHAGGAGRMQKAVAGDAGRHWDEGHGQRLMF